MIWIGSSSCSSSSQHKKPTKQTESRAPNNQKAGEIEQDSEAAAMESRSLETCSRSSISLFHKTMAGMQLPSVRLPHAAVKFDKGSTQSVTLARSSPVRNQQEDTCSISTKVNVQESNVVMRRTMLSLMSSSLFAAAAATSSFAGAKPMMPMMEEPDLPRFRKTPSGVKIQEVVDGSGPMAKTGDTLEFNFVCRRSNGYFVYSTVDQFNDQSQPAVLPLGVGKIIPGLEEVLAGMRLGGKRRALIPPEVGYTDALLEPQPKEFGPRRALMSHAKEPLVFEVQLLKIR